jgi:hypothetical protein
MAQEQAGVSSKDQREQSEHILFIGAKRALVGGLLAAGVAVFGQLLVGQIYSGTEARQLMDAMVPSARAAGTGVVSATATIMALMLTMLSLSRHATSRLESVFFKRVERIGLLCTVALISGSLLLLILSVPLEESQNVPQTWFTIMYYALIVLTAAVVAMLVAIVLMLYNAMESLIHVLRPDMKGAAMGSKIAGSPAPAGQGKQKEKA